MRVRFARLLLSTALGATLSQVQSGFASDEGASMFRGNPAHTGVYQHAEIRSIGQQLWKIKTDGAIRGTPVLHKGRVFFGSGDGWVRCANIASGKQNWKYGAGTPVHSSPMVLYDHVYFTDRANTLHALNSSNGRLLWKRVLADVLPYDWGFDYYQSSPAAAGGRIFVGGGDGTLYAIEPERGRVVWTHKASSIVRSTPAIDSGRVFYGDCAGRVYALDAATGKELWVYRIVGDTLRNEDYGFDRKAIISSPAISNGIVIIGGRDGFLYALEAASGKLLWKVDYNVSWVISSAAIQDSVVVTGTSDGQYVNAIGLKSGKELWRFKGGAPFWASPIIAARMVIAAGNDGFIYLLDLATGNERSRYRLGERIFSSPILHDSVLVIGCDDGSLYALRTSTAPAAAQSVHKAVYWIDEPPLQFFKGGLDVYVRDYFTEWGYEQMDNPKLEHFLGERIRDGAPSVVVFATNFFPEAVVRGTYKDCLLYRYLAAGGKVVVLGPNPAMYGYDFEKNSITGFQYSRSDSILGIAYPFNDLRTTAGLYPSRVTSEGRRWGLSQAIAGHSALDPAGITPLALNEEWKASYWVRNYGYKDGTGFVQLLFSRNIIGSIDDVRRIAEHGLNSP